MGHAWVKLKKQMGGFLLQGGVSISAHIRVPIIRLNWVPIIR